MILLIDGNNWIIRNYFGMNRKNEFGSFETLTTSDGRESGTLFGSISSFCTLVKALEPSHILWCFDSGRSTFRTKIRPEYKANRNKDIANPTIASQTNFKPSFESFREFLSLVGIRYTQEHNVEADDIIASACTKFSNETDVVIVSQDHDLLQLVRENVFVLKPSSVRGKPDTVFDELEVVNKYGLLPEELPMLWALTGDIGDNIEGVRGVAEKTALKILLENDLDLSQAVRSNTKVVQQNAAKRVLDNYKLINLDSTVANFSVTLDECRFNPHQSTDLLREFLADWEMNSLVSKLDAGELW